MLAHICAAQGIDIVRISNPRVVEVGLLNIGAMTEDVVVGIGGIEEDEVGGSAKPTTYKDY